jgi:hypothetical protein
VEGGKIKRIREQCELLEWEAARVKGFTEF